jgi:IS1 family transposase/transposase-like protein
MAEQSSVRFWLVVALAWGLASYWVLFVRDWPGWQQLKGWRAPKRGRRRPKLYRKPKPFAGLTRKPVCAQCAAAEAAEQGRVSREPPPKIERGRGRRPEVDTSRQFCPYEECTYYGWLNRGNVIANGHPNSGRWRQLQCVVCGRYFQETVGTMFYGSSASTEDIIRALVALCEGVSPRKVARIFGVDKDTVLSWLAVVSGHAEAVLGYVMHELELEQVQMDELYALLREVREEGEKRRSCWVWAAVDPASKLLLAVEVGERSAKTAQRLVHGVAGVLAAGVVPLFLTDQFAAYGRALLTHFGHWVEQKSEQSGRVLRRWVPDERLAYAQVKKRRVRRRIVDVARRVVYGTPDGVQGVLSKVGQKINTAFIERVNRTLR